MKRVICFLAVIEGNLYSNVDFKELVKEIQEGENIDSADLYSDELCSFSAVLENGDVVNQPIDIELVKLPIYYPKGF